MVNTNISKSEKIVANTRVEKIVSKFKPPWHYQLFTLKRRQQTKEKIEYLTKLKEKREYLWTLKVKLWREKGGQCITTTPSTGEARTSQGIEEPEKTEDRPEEKIQYVDFTLRQQFLPFFYVKS